MKNLFGGNLAPQRRREEMTAREAFERRNSLIGCDMIRRLYNGTTVEYNNLTNIESDRGTSDENGRVLDHYIFTFTSGYMPSLPPNERVTFIFNNDNSNNNILDQRPNDNNRSLQLAGRRKRKTHRRKSHKRKSHRRKSRRSRGSRRK